MNADEYKINGIPVSEYIEIRIKDSRLSYFYAGCAVGSLIIIVFYWLVT